MLKREEALRLIRSIARQAGASVVEREESIVNGEASRIADDATDLVLELRLRPDPQPTPPIPPPPGAPPRRYKVLHVEAMNRTADLVYYYLRANYDVDSEETAEAGLARALESYYDYLLVDLKEGKGMSGYELTEILRETEHYAKLPIIAISAYSSRKDVDRCIEVGCSAFLSKPFLKEDLLRLMHQLEPQVPNQA